MILKDYMLVEIPVYIDWTKFGNDISDDKKQNLLEKMQKDLISKPIISNATNPLEKTDYTDHYVAGTITNATIVGTDKISAFGLMWVEATPEFQTKISFATGDPELEIIGVNITPVPKLNDTFQKIKEMKTKIEYNIEKAMKQLNISKDGDKNDIS